MSYNIIASETLSGSAALTGRQLRQLFSEHGRDSFPEICFLHDLDPYALDDAELEVSEFGWAGCWSGNSFELLIGKVLPILKGKAKILYTWEDGDQTVVEIDDGCVLERAPNRDAI